jgi:hypothetical protein
MPKHDADSHAPSLTKVPAQKGLWPRKGLRRLLTTTDFTQTLPIRIPPDLLPKILNDGANADAAILAAETQGIAPPVGVWKDMYNDIFLMIDNNQISGVPPEQKYWFQQARYITADKENVPSGYFVRDVTAVGFNVAGPSDAEVQAISNQIGTRIFDYIKNHGALPAFWGHARHRPCLQPDTRAGTLPARHGGCAVALLLPALSPPGSTP